MRWHTASANQRPVSVPLWPMRGRDSVSFVTPALAIISHFPIPAFVSHLNRDPIKSHGHYLLSIGELSITRLFREGGGAFLPHHNRLLIEITGVFREKIGSSILPVFVFYWHLFCLFEDVVGIQAAKG